jgi:hypothetical protein
MPAEVKDRAHALARCAKAHRGLRFTDSEDNDLDALYPDDDDNSDYTPTANDNSFDGDDNSDSTPDDTSSASTAPDKDPYIPDPPVAPPLELAGVNNIPVENTGVDKAHNNPVKNAGVDEDHIETTGMDENRTDLEEYIQELESVLDNEIVTYSNSPMMMEPKPIQFVLAQPENKPLLMSHNQAAATIQMMIQVTMTMHHYQDSAKRERQHTAT